jgi:hypothetical protein
MIKQKMFKNQNIWLFFVITYAFSWLFWIPDALIANGVQLPSIIVNFLSSPFNPAAFGPLVAALFLIYSRKGIRGVTTLLKRGASLQFKKIWLIPIFLLLPLIYSSAILLAKAFGWMTLDFTNLSNPVAFPFAFIYILLLGGPLQEEFGWRGYALDRLEERFNALISSIVLGLFWAFWHLPAVFSNKLIVNAEFFWLFTIQIVLISIIFTWIYNNTERSILSVLILHTMNNFFIWLMLPTMKMPLGFLVFSILMIFIVDMIILSVWGTKKMVR